MLLSHLPTCLPRVSYLPSYFPTYLLTYQVVGRAEGVDGRDRGPPPLAYFGACEIALGDTDLLDVGIGELAAAGDVEFVKECISLVLLRRDVQLGQRLPKRAAQDHAAAGLVNALEEFRRLVSRGAEDDHQPAHRRLHEHERLLRGHGLKAASPSTARTRVARPLLDESSYA